LHGIKLPTLPLPTFNGDTLKWQTFWDTFKSAVHENVSLSAIQKFTHLKAQLLGEAANSVKGLPLTESNYDKTITILIERFGQPHKIINAHMQALLDLPSPTNSVTQLRRFFDGMENHIRSLETLGKTQETYGDLLTPIILAKLPTAIKQPDSRKRDKQMGNRTIAQSDFERNPNIRGWGRNRNFWPIE
jgi:hypothetical protein